MPSLPISIPFTFANATANVLLSSLDTDLLTVAQAINGIGNGTTTLTNVTITGGSITNFSGNLITINGGTINAANTQIGSLAANAVVTTNASGVMVTLAAGTVGNVLTATNLAVAGATVNIAHSLGGVPFGYQVYLQNAVAEGGWQIGDTLMAPNSDSSGGQLGFYADASNVSVITDSTGAVRVLRKDSGVNFAITLGNWRLIAKAWI